jgi:His/Glu/Gln/Arg/opine family amino acid ABC transporter permease subunit
MSDHLEFVWDQMPNLLWGFPSRRPGGLLLTILLSAGAIGVGLVLAMGLAAASHSRLRIVRMVSSTITRVVRGVPLIVLLVLLFQVLATGTLLGIEFSAFWAAAVTLTLYSAAYQSDVLRVGIAAVPDQLRESARLLGASPSMIARSITMPYALRVTRPALVTQAITIFKDSSAVVVLGVADLTTNARIALGGDVTRAPYWVTTYLVVGLLYWIVAFGLSRCSERAGIGGPSIGATRGA